MTQTITYSTAGNNSTIKMYLWRWVNNVWYLDNQGLPIYSNTVSSPSTGSGTGSQGGVTGGIYTVTAQIERGGVIVKQYNNAGYVTAP